MSSAVPTFDCPVPSKLGFHYELREPYETSLVRSRGLSKAGLLEDFPGKRRTRGNAEPGETPNPGKRRISHPPISIHFLLLLNQLINSHYTN